jgi:outer membrane protein assembly factor BamB
MIAGFVVILLVLFIPRINVKAATKATKIKYKTIYEYEGMATEKLTVKGFDSKGKVVWKYTTKKFMQAQLEQVACVVKKSRVYVFAGNKVICFKKSTGKKLWVCKNVSPAGYKYTFDSSNNLYLVGYFCDDIYKISSKGKVLWKTNVKSTGNYLPIKLKCKGKKLIIKYEESLNDYNYDCSINHRVVLSRSTGKILSYK